MTIHSTTAAVCLLLVVAGCAELESLDPESCGNGVVEPEIAEDCDGRVDPALGEDLECGSEDAGGQACRYVCDGAECPIGWTCEDDGICRAPSGQYESPDTPLLVLASDQLLLADLNGDVRSELIVRVGGDLSIFAHDDEGFARDVELSVPHARGSVSVADLDQDEWADLLIPAATNASPDATLQVHALRRGPQRLQTVVLPQQETSSLGFADVDRAVAVVSVEPTVGSLAGVPLVIGDGEESRVAFVPEPTCRTLPPTAVATLATAPSAGAPLPLPTIAATDSRAAVVAVPVPGQTTVELLTVTRSCEGECPDPAGGVATSCLSTVALHDVVELDEPVTAPGCAFWDFNADDLLDLVCHVGTADDIVGAPAEGSKFGDPLELSSTIADRALPIAGQSRKCAAGNPLLAATDLDGDTFVDLVTPHGVYRATVLGYELVYARVRGDGWAEVGVGDFDGDGARELVASVVEADSDCQPTRLEHLVPRVGSFIATVVPDSALPSRIAIGDFDGDGRDDVGMQQPTDEGEARLVVFYGDAKEALEDRVQLGNYAEITALAAVRSRIGTDLNEDLLSDLAVVSDAGEQWTLVTGTPERSLLAPLSLSGAAVGSAPVTVLGGRLLGSADEELPPDVLALTTQHRWLLNDENVHHGDFPQSFPAQPGAVLAAVRFACARWAVAERGELPALLAVIDGFAPGGPSCDPDGVPPVLAFVEAGHGSLLSRPAVVPVDFRRPSAIQWARFGDDLEDPADLMVVGTRGARGAVLVAENGSSALVDLVPQQDVWAAAAINADRDAGDELVIVTPTGLLVVDVAGGAGGLSAEIVGDAGTLPFLPPLGTRVELLPASLDEDDLPDLLLVMGQSLFAFPAEAVP